MALLKIYHGDTKSRSVSRRQDTWVERIQKARRRARRDKFITEVRTMLDCKLRKLLWPVIVSCTTMASGQTVPDTVKRPGFDSITPGIFLEAVRNECAPAAIVNVKSEPMIVMCALLAEAFFKVQIPIVDGLEGNLQVMLRTGIRVRINGTTGTIEVVRRG